MTVFYSYQHIDGRVTDGVFSSVLTTGLHRTESERSARHRVARQVAGANVTYRHQHVEVGLTLVHTHLSDTLRPTPKPYNVNYFSGVRQTVGGIHYRLRLHRFNLFGETALTDRPAVATLNGLQYVPIEALTLVVLHRYYSPTFDNMHASAFGAASRNHAETGFYLAATLRAPARWQWDMAADAYRHLMPRSQISVPSDGLYTLLHARYTPRGNTEMSWRIRYDQRGTNLTDSVVQMPLVGTLHKASLRYQLKISHAPLGFQTQLDANLARIDRGEVTCGYAATQDVTCTMAQERLMLALRLQVFHTPTYHNRIYTYERDVLGAFCIPALIGQGGRIAFNVRYALGEHVVLWFKAAQTIYADRSEIGSGNDAIRSNHKTDLRLQASFRL